MKVAKSEAPFTLQESDTITCGVTHEIKVGGEKSWVKYEVTRAVTDESVIAEQAAAELQAHVDAQVMKNIHITVETVRNQ